MIGVATAVVYFLLAILSRVGDQWRLLMVGLAAVSLIGMMPRYDVGIVPHHSFLLYYEMLMLAGIVGLLFLMIIVAIDLGGRQRRDIFHWLGVATLAWGIVVNSMIWPVLARGTVMP